MAQFFTSNYGGNSPSLKRDANGVLFFGVNDPTRGNAFHVTRRFPNGRREDVLLTEFIGGQGKLEELPDGLYAVGPATTGNNAPIVYVRIPEFVVAQPPAELWLADLTAANDADGKTWLRLNNMRHILAYVLARLR